VLHEIRQSILTGALAPGEPFVVQTLTEKLGVSHVPVREALRQLESQGLVTLSPSRSAVVTPLDPGSLREIYRLRQWIEPELAALSAPERPDTDLRRLAELIEGTFRQPKTEGQWDLHREFHELLIAPAAGEWDLRVLNILWFASERFTRLLLGHVAVPEEETDHRKGKHQELLDAARGRDPEELRAALREHLAENEHVAAERLRLIPLSSEKSAS
jgi:DNA-binding GntR family transcriptional regulator